MDVDTVGAGTRARKIAQFAHRCMQIASCTSLSRYHASHRRLKGATTCSCS